MDLQRRYRGRHPLLIVMRHPVAIGIGLIAGYASRELIIAAVVDPSVGTPGIYAQGMVALLLIMATLPLVPFVACLCFRRWRILTATAAFYATTLYPLYLDADAWDPLDLSMWVPVWWLIVTAGFIWIYPRLQPPFEMSSAPPPAPDPPMKPGAGVSESAPRRDP